MNKQKYIDTWVDGEANLKDLNELLDSIVEQKDNIKKALPSDEEIEKKAEFRQNPRNPKNDPSEEFIYGFMQGAEWVKEGYLKPNNTEEKEKKEFCNSCNRLLGDNDFCGLEQCPHHISFKQPEEKEHPDIESLSADWRRDNLSTNKESKEEQPKEVLGRCSICNTRYCKHQPIEDNDGDYHKRNNIFPGSGYGIVKY